MTSGQNQELKLIEISTWSDETFNKNLFKEDTVNISEALAASLVLSFSMF